MAKDFKKNLMQSTEKRIAVQKRATPWEDAVFRTILEKIF
jgi:hypothetical protein